MGTSGTKTITLSNNITLNRVYSGLSGGAFYLRGSTLIL